VFFETVVLLSVGILFILLALALIIYLILSHKQSKIYRRILYSETQTVNTIIKKEYTSNDKKSYENNNASVNTHIEKLIDVNEEENYTRKLFDNKKSTTPIKDTRVIIKDIDISVLNNKYQIISEITGGGMSRVFIAQNIKLGNLWILKYVPNKIGDLSNEVEILKRLNHTSLPQIVDIFDNKDGVFIVESYIEGISLDKVIHSDLQINELIILDWAEQLANVLDYLHNHQIDPIYHFDLKPSNIIVTHANRLVLIDFGISKIYGSSEKKGVGLSYSYAAPEQFKHVKMSEKQLKVIEDRFGELPADRLYWDLNCKTDIYSFGVILFEMVIKAIPTLKNKKFIDDKISIKLSQLINKCIAVNPSDRYDNITQVISAIQNIKNQNKKITGSLYKRKIITSLSIVFIIISILSTAGCYYMYAKETNSSLIVNPEILTLSVRQSGVISIEQLFKEEKVKNIDVLDIKWTFLNDDIVRVSDGKILGMNLGETVIKGEYRNKYVDIEVKVIDPLDNNVKILQKFKTDFNYTMEVYAGTSERDLIDGNLNEAELISPESIDFMGDEVYFTDSGQLRKIENGIIESIKLDRNYISVKSIKCYNNDIYLLSHDWEDDGYHYGMFKYDGDTLEELLIKNSIYTYISDFTISNDIIYFVEYNAGVEKTYLNKYDLKNGEIETLSEIPEGISSITISDNNTIFLSNLRNGVIYSFIDNKLIYFAGIENNKAFIDDSQMPLFYQPNKIKYWNDCLYIWDFNVLRCINLLDDAMADVITIIGEVSPKYDIEINTQTQLSKDIILPNNELTDFIILNDKILLTDSKHGVIWSCK